jgi:hypothetical protein
MAQNRVTRGTAAVGALAVGTGTVVKGVKYGTAAVDFASVTNGETGSATFTVTGAATADIVIVNPPALTTGLVFGGASVTAANTVTVYVTNASAAPIDESEVTFKYCWIDLT